MEERLNKLEENFELLCKNFNDCNDWNFFQKVTYGCRIDRAENFSYVAIALSVIANIGWVVVLKLLLAS